MSVKITDAMVERAAKILRRIDNPAAQDRRPWREILSKEVYRKRARKVLTAALRGAS